MNYNNCIPENIIEAIIIAVVSIAYIAKKIINYKNREK